MRVLALTISSLLASACASDGSTTMQSSNGHGDGDDGGGGTDGGLPCGTTDAPIVFAAALDGQAAPDLYIMVAHDQRPARLTDTPGAESLPSWSPDRKHVAFVRDRQLFVIDLPSGREHLVAAKIGRDREISGASWSPDGTRLVYPYPRDPFIIITDPTEGPKDHGFQTTLHIVNADGTNDVPFEHDVPDPNPNIPPGMGTLSEPAWSSSNRIAFESAGDCLDCAGGIAWFVANPDGTDLVAIEPHSNDVPLIVRHGLDWSPDATHWIYTAHATTFPHEQPGIIATRSVATFDDVRALTPDGAWHPRYSPDGMSIAFLRADGIYVMHENGTASHRIVAATDVSGLDW